MLVFNPHIQINEVSISGGKDIVIDAAGDATLKAAKNVVLKGQKILEN